MKQEKGNERWRIFSLWKHRRVYGSLLLHVYVLFGGGLSFLVFVQLFKFFGFFTAF
jgi:hypothetical protein